MVIKKDVIMSGNIFLAVDIVDNTCELRHTLTVSLKPFSSCCLVDQMLYLIIVK